MIIGKKVFYGERILHKKVVPLKFIIIAICSFMLFSNVMALMNEQIAYNNPQALPQPRMDYFIFKPMIDAPSLNSPSNGAIINDDTPLLHWNPVSGADHWRIQMDNNNDFSSPEFNVLTSSFTGSDTDIVSNHLVDGFYFWRVRAYNFLGVWGDWSLVWHFTVDTVPPGIPTKIQPTNNGLTNDPSPFFDWNTVPTATRYQLVVDNNADFTSPELNVQTSNSYYTGHNFVDNKYYWHVRARDAAGNWGGWSTVWYFTIDTVPPPAPSLYLPPSGFEISSKDVSLDWIMFEHISQYHLQVDDNSDFSSPVISHYTTASIATVHLVDDGCYYWRVRAKDAAGNWGRWSSARNFIVDTTPPNAPSLNSPPNGTTTNDPTPYLHWLPTPTATLYKLEVSNHADMTSPFISELISSNSYTCVSLSDGNYYWHVQAKDNVGNWGDWSETWSFQIDTTPPPTLMLISPNNNSIMNDPTPRLCWVWDSSSVLYQLQVDNTIDFSSTIINLTLINSVYNFVSNLPDGIYYWHVRSRDAVGNWGNWSIIWNFTVDTIAPTITNINQIPTIPTDVEIIVFNCDVEDLNGITSVSLFYKIDNGSWNNITMALIAGKTFQASLGPFAYNTSIAYYFVALDSAIDHNKGINNNEGLNYQFTVVSSDIIGPDITAISNEPINPTDNESITIYCNVTDENGVQAVFLIYRVNKNSWNNLSMTHMTGFTYEIEIGIFAYNDFIDYYFVTFDSSPNHNFAVNNNSGTYYNFIISSSDISAPTIHSVTHTPDTPNSTQSITISCIAIDENGINNVTLFYRKNGGSWVSLIMFLSTNNTYSATIGTFSNNSFIEYYICAFDASPNQNIATNNNLYYSFTVYTPSPPPTTPPQSTGKTPIGFMLPSFVIVLLLLSLRKKRK